MRGKAILLLFCKFNPRITPAYAGKRPAKPMRHSLRRDHPRLCGEKLSGTWSTTSAVGSPPPMRGKGGIEDSDKIADGITPAYAGKRTILLFQSMVCRDHPRLCGEKEHQFQQCRSSRGSPPPMRGKGLCCHLIPSFYGITPAYAGKRVSGLDVDRLEEDHPRLCGEKIYDGKQCKLGRGSPPPMRGKVCWNWSRWSVDGITPAYAGKRRKVKKGQEVYKDHPRLCGEKPFQWDKKLSLQGSPPPMRGKGKGFFSFDNLHRITPAYAGKS